MNRKICKCCDREIKTIPILIYKNMPTIAQNFPDKDNVYMDKGEDINIFQCPDCGLVQILQEPVPYYKDVIRAVAVSEDMRMFREEYFDKFIRICNLKNKRIIEIGAGCGEYMQMFQDKTVDIYGIEHLEGSVNKGKENGLKLWQDYIESSEHYIKGYPYDGFYIMNYLEHVPNPKEFMKGIANNLSEEAYGLIEVPNGDFILKNYMWSEFMLDHLSYFTKENLEMLLKLSGFEVISSEVIWHGYILSVIVKKRKLIDVSGLQLAQDTVLESLKKYFEKNKGKRIAVWGAGHQALAIMAMANMQSKIVCVIDSAVFKQNKFTPATHIPIVSPEKICEMNIDNILVIAGSYSDEVCKIVKEKWENIEVNSWEDI